MNVGDLRAPSQIRAYRKARAKGGSADLGVIHARIVARLPIHRVAVLSFQPRPGAIWFDPANAT